MLELRDLKAGYGSRTVLQIETLDFCPGQITTILGRNGCGKSTLLRAIRGMIPCRGTVRLGGEDLRKLEPRERAKRVAYLPQSLMVPEMDVYTLAAHGRFCRKRFSGRLGEEDRAAVRRAMEETDVWHLRERKLRQLSGGERQRAYLAMVIAQDAPFLLLDEPEASMDIAHQIELAERFRALADRGKGLIVSSHDLPMSFARSDRIVLLAEGRVFAEGSPQKLAGQTELIRRVMGASLTQEGSGEGLFPYVIAK